MSNFKIGDIAGFNVGDVVVYEVGCNLLFEVVRNPKTKKLQIRRFYNDKTFGFIFKPISKLRLADPDEIISGKRL